ncbi:hypothetical protein [Acerihabitans arboris]|uniref:Uncharacterized protein n=1 Tax=Acerihabitans arboris TaxID=2691583 RepID=A0A845SJS9_9GAMM|nr:hypothetical protein [Acerihabitans arboris]NDL61585.1 hypothetical protein [Acerihabitans arboris]
MPDELLTGYVLRNADRLIAVDNNMPKTRCYSIEHFIQETDLRPCHFGALRYFHGMNWFEHADIGSLDARLHFISSLVDRIIAMDLPRPQPLTLISLGAGGLLAEYLITRLLAAEGFTDLRWRCIDVKYAQDRSHAAISAFTESTGMRLEAFTTEQAYLYPENNAKTLALEDRSNGAIVLLSMAPPTMLMNELPPSQNNVLTGCIWIRGQITQDLSEANCICIIYTLNDYIDDYYEKLTNGLADSNKITWLNCVVKCSVDNHGQFDIDCSNDKYADIIYARLTGQLRDLWKHARHQGERMSCVAPILGLPHIITAVGLLRMQMPALPVTLKLFLFNDYDIALAGLRAFLRDSHRPTLFASFEHNTTIIE